MTERLAGEVAEGRGRNPTLVICELEPCITIGRVGSRADVRLSDDDLRARRLAVRFTGRGGGAVLHGPGQVVVAWSAALADLGLEKTSAKVEFFQGDACNLKPHFANYDLILAANLIDRLYSPLKFLTSVHERLNLGGLLLIASPYTWLEEHTPRAQWLGGFKKDGENFSTLDGLKAVLTQHFSLLQGPLDVPFVIRETRRKLQHSCSELTIWERTT